MHRRTKKRITLWSTSSEMSGSRSNKMPKVMVRYQGKNIGWLKVLDTGAMKLIVERESDFAKDYWATFDLPEDQVEVGYDSTFLSPEEKQLVARGGLEKREMEIHAALHDAFANDENKKFAKTAWKTTASPYNPAGASRKLWQRVAFQMPLPLKASDRRIAAGIGYTDLMLRFRNAGAAVPIGLVEVKKDTIDRSACVDAFCQAIAYSAGLRKMLGDARKSSLYLGLLGLAQRHRVPSICAMPALPENAKEHAAKLLSEIESSNAGLDSRIPITFQYLLYKGKPEDGTFDVVDFFPQEAKRIA